MIFTQLSTQFSLRDWNGILSIPLGGPTISETTPTPTEATPTSQDAEEVVVLYGTVFGVLLLVCVFVTVVILLLKCVQITRRDTDKG